MADPERRCYEFDRFRFDAHRLELQAGQEVVDLPQRSLRALKILLEQRGETVSRDEMLRLIWHDAFVEDSNLTVAVAALRRAFGDHGWLRDAIQTVPREGYRFVADVRETVEFEEGPVFIGRYTREEITVETGSVGWRALLPAAINSRFRMLTAATGMVAILLFGLALVSPSGNGAAETDHKGLTIAVMPMRSLSHNTDDAAVRLGIADTISARLEASNDIRVVGVGATERFLDRSYDAADIARRLGVSQLLDGTYIESNGKIRVNLRIVQGADGRTLWSGVYDGSTAALFTLHDQLAEGAMTAPGAAEQRARCPNGCPITLKHFTIM